MTDAMISYSRRDTEFVKKLHDRLDAEGREIWVDWEDIPKTAEWWAEIKDGIEKADNFIFIISPDSVDSEVCGWEIDHAIEHNKRLVPLLHREVVDPEIKKKMREQLNSHNWIFARETDDFDKTYEEVVKAIDTDLDHVKAHTRLLVRATEWDKAERDRSLLLRGSDLRKAENWIKGSAGKQPAPDQLQRLYVRQGRHASNRRLGMWSLGTVVTMIVSFLALFAMYQANIAEQQRTAALEAQEEAQELALASSALVAYDGDNLDLAVALALEAAESQARPETLRALSTAGYAPGTRLNLGVGSPVTSVDFSPDGTLGLTGSEDGLLRLWDFDTGQELRHLEGHESAIWGVEFSKDGALLLSGSEDNTVILWDVATGEIRQRFTGHDGPVWDVAISPDCGRGASAGQDGAIIVWNLETGEEIERLEGHEGAIWTVAFSPDGSLMVSGGVDRVAILWDTTTGEELERFVGHEGTVTDVAFSPDSETIYTVSKDKNIFAWTIGNGGTPQSFGIPGSGHNDGIISIDVSPNGEYLVTGGEDNQGIVWRVHDGVEINELHGHSSTINSVAFDADGSQLLTGSQDGTTRLWDVINGAQLYSLQGSDSDVWSVTFSPDGNNVIGNNDMTLIHVETGEMGVHYEADDPIGQVGFSPDGRVLAGAAESGDVYLWDVNSGDELIRYTGHTAAAWTSLFTSDSRRVISGGDDSELHLWDGRTGELIRKFEGHQGSAWTAAISPDDHFLASASDAGEIFLWDVRTGELIREFTDEVHTRSEFGDSLEIWEVTYNPDGNLIATGDNRNLVIIWDVHTGEAMHILQGHRGLVSTVAFSLDGRFLLSGAFDNEIIMWDVHTGKELRRFTGHSNIVTDVTISPDGKTVVSGSGGGNLRVWYVHTPDDLLTWVLDNRHVRDLTCAERNLYDIAPLCERSDNRPRARPVVSQE